MWMLEHIGVPAALGLMVGVLVRSIIKTLLVLVLLGAVAVFYFSKTGGGSLDPEQVDQAQSILPTLSDLARGAFSALKSSPAAVIGLALGVVLREKWRRR